MPAGLNVADVVSVSVSLAPTAAPPLNFGSLLIIGPSNVIDTNSRYRTYTTLSAVAGDFGTTAPEYLAAVNYFAQSPAPGPLLIGKWAQNPTPGSLTLAALGGNAVATLASRLGAISAGSFGITVGGTAFNISANFSGVQNPFGAAFIINQALAAANCAASCAWNASNSTFVFQTTATGTAATISGITAGTTGTDISGIISGVGNSNSVAGIAAETPLQAFTALDQATNAWYGGMFAPTNVGDITTSQHLAVGSYTEAASRPHAYGVTSNDATMLVSTQTADIASLFQASGFTRSLVQYSSSSPYAVASLFGRAFSTNFAAQNSVITLFGKQEPAVVAETLSETQAATLIAKNANVFVNYQNGAAIIQPGVMSSGLFFDIRYGVDWLANAMQTALFNAIYQAPTKIPQTDAGGNMLLTVAEGVLAQGVNNGLIAPGVWNSTLAFGTLTPGMTLAKGYYAYISPMASQPQTTRAQRIAPPIQTAIKLAGAIQNANCSISVNV